MNTHRFALSSFLHKLRNHIFHGLFPKQCVEFIQLCQALKRLWLIMEVECAVGFLRVFKNGEISEIPLFSGPTRNSWKRSEGVEVKQPVDIFKS